MKKNTILNQEIKVAINPSEAWNNGMQYFNAVESEAYKDLDKNQLTTLIRSAASLQKSSGHICLYEDPEMPADARVDIIHKPSYAISAIAIYAMCNYPSIFDEDMKRFFKNILEGAFQYGIIGHGIESEETVRRTLLMLCKAGVKSFLATHSDEYPTFTKMVNQHINHYLAQAKAIDEDKIIITANGFSFDSNNHLIKELVAYWNGNTQPVFVYGTLMKGECANSMLASGEYAGAFLLKDYVMYHLGSYPGIKHCAGESVYGELYYVSPSVVEHLDKYEGEGSLYKRTGVKLEAANSAIFAETYVYIHDTSNCQKIREAWNSHDDDLVWYAGYGSNLSSERFSCYISGGTCAENGRTYPGSSDHTLPRFEKRCTYHGALYFGNKSSSWDGHGVAFFDPNPADKDALVYMKRYLITRRQLHDVMAQEGQSANWYGKLVCLEVDSLGIPVYTLTSETKRPDNTPSPVYVELISKVLREEFKLGKRQIRGYLRIK